jgi:hypothetical protein
MQDEINIKSKKRYVAQMRGMGPFCIGAAPFSLYTNL